MTEQEMFNKAADLAGDSVKLGTAKPESQAGVWYVLYADGVVVYSVTLPNGYVVAFTSSVYRGYADYSVEVSYGADWEEVTQAALSIN